MGKLTDRIFCFMWGHIYMGDTCIECGHKKRKKHKRKKCSSDFCSHCDNDNTSTLMMPPYIP